MYRSLRDCVNDLEKHHQLIRCHEPVDPDLEVAAIQRRLYALNAPAVLFENVKGTSFPILANLFGDPNRTKFIFRKTFGRVAQVLQLKAQPSGFLKRPFSYPLVPWTVVTALPLRLKKAPVMECETSIDRLPLIKSWPDDGGAFITLPQVYSESPKRPGILNSNLGMYRVQLNGNQYTLNKEVGLHYQIHRGIGVHHAEAVTLNRPLKVSIFVGGPPAHSFAAVMPLPEGITELTFAGMLGGRNFRYQRVNEHVISAEADFCIIGTIYPNETKPEGPFGDHLGYYSLAHDFPVLHVERVFHRKDAIWPFTVVGRPPQEDTSFGKIIHELTGPLVPSELPGLKAIHAVDAAGVHPLLLAIGQERYTPYDKTRRPQEILTLANALLGFGQCSLAKYLFIVAAEDNPDLNVNHISDFLIHLLERFDPCRDLHFQTCTTIDTLDYSGTGLNQGSKLVICAAGEKKRQLATSVPQDLELGLSFSNPRMAMPGVLAIKADPFSDYPTVQLQMQSFVRAQSASLDRCPLIVVCDDSEFCAQSLENFLWITFTRSNPSHDVYGIDSFYEFKHWGCKGALIIDARRKPHHAPPLVEPEELAQTADFFIKEKLGL